MTTTPFSRWRINTRSPRAAAPTSLVNFSLASEAFRTSFCLDIVPVTSFLVQVYYITSILHQVYNINFAGVTVCRAHAFPAFPKTSARPTGRGHERGNDPVAGRQTGPDRIGHRER